MSTISWRDGQIVDRDWPLDQISERVAAGELVWAHVDSPSVDLTRLIARECGFDRHTVEDALAPAERTKATRQGERVFVTMYAASLDGEHDHAHTSRLATHRISVFATDRALITLAPDADVDMAPVIDRWGGALPGYGGFGLLQGLIDVVIDHHFEVIERLDQACENLEDVLFDPRGHGRTVQQASYRIRRELAELRRVVLPMRNVVQVIMRSADDPGRHPQLRGYYEDIDDHALRAAEWTESLRDMVASIFETNLSLQDSRLNIIMKKLAGWAAVIAIPTAVTGWFGQNVPFPGFSTPAGYWASVAAIVVSTVAVWVFMRRRDWI